MFEERIGEQEADKAGGRVERYKPEDGR